MTCELCSSPMQGANALIPTLPSSPGFCRSMLNLPPKQSLSRFWMSQGSTELSSKQYHLPTLEDWWPNSARTFTRLTACQQSAVLKPSKASKMLEFRS